MFKRTLARVAAALILGGICQHLWGFFWPGVAWAAVAIAVAALCEWLLGRALAAIGEAIGRRVPAPRLS